MTNSIHTKDLLQWVDLGLPSKTFWAKYNYGVDQYHLNSEKDWYGNYYSFKEANELKDVTLPTKEQISELITYTTQFWCSNYNSINGLNGVEFIGRNENKIFIPAAGAYWIDINLYGMVGDAGAYWSSTSSFNGRQCSCFLYLIKYRDLECYIDYDTSYNTRHTVRPILNTQNNETSK